MSELLQLSIDGAEANWKILAADGVERIGAPFRWTIGLVTPVDAPLDEATLVGAKATLTLGAETSHEVHGIVAEIALLHAWGDHALYRISVAPKLWCLSLSHHSRVFVEQTIPDILVATLEAGQITDYELRLSGDYRPWLHVSQYRESDLAFLTRWMEREGIYYFFDHSGGSDKLIVTDDIDRHDSSPSAPVRYDPAAAGDVSSGEALQELTMRHRVTTAEVTMRDYDPLKPTLAVEGKKALDGPSVGASAYFGENEPDPDAAARFARLRAEEQAAQRRLLRANGRVFGLRSGFCFEVGSHPMGSLNRAYLATVVHHHVNQAAADEVARALLDVRYDEEYRAEVEAVPTDAPFRLACVTPWPRVSGTERGTIDGPADSEYAQLDEHGRYALKLAYDESDLTEGKASTRLRMLQPHGGEPEGYHFPLRKGSEVDLAFLRGDPDRPVVVGAVPNAIEVSPVTSQNHTHNVIQTGSKNRLDMEDLDGSQYIDFSTPPKDTRVHLGEPHDKHTHYIVEHTDGDCMVDIGATRDIEIGSDQNEHVVKNVDETYRADQTTKVTGAQVLDVGSVRDIDVGGQQHETVTKDVIESYPSQKTTIGGPLVEKAKTVKEKYATQKTTVKGLVKEKLGSQKKVVNGPLTLTVKKATTEHYASLTTKVKGDYTITVGSQQELLAAASLDITTDSWNIVMGDWLDAAFAKFEGVTGVADGGFGFKLGVAAQVAEAFGNKVELTGAAISLTGASKGKVGAEASAGPTLIVTGAWIEL